jgi:dTDP-4-amino-4,6-dideoxygalactose transaminase
VRYEGGTPVFADVRPDLWTIDADAAAAAVTGRTVGIIAVDAFGQPADYDELAALAESRGLWLIEDAACAAGASYRGRPAGSFGDIASFSFHGRKGITAGEGGALVTDDDELAAATRRSCRCSCAGCRTCWLGAARSPSATPSCSATATA